MKTRLYFITMNAGCHHYKITSPPITFLNMTTAWWIISALLARCMRNPSVHAPHKMPLNAELCFFCPKSCWTINTVAGDFKRHERVTTATVIINIIKITGLKLENYYFFTFTFSRPEVRKLLLFYVFTFSRPEVRKLFRIYVFTFSRPEDGKLFHISMA